MFLHCVAKNKAEVKLPWSRFRQHGNSLFLFRLVAGLIFFLCLVLFIGAIVLFAVLLHKNSQHLTIPLVLALILLLLITIPAAIAFALLLKFTHDFVVPIMYLRSASCIDAWRQFWTLLSNNKARFTLYILFQILIAMAVGAIVFAAILLTCCCAACVLSIPYIGTVLLLPLLIFQRAYSLYYFRQFGPQFDLLSTPETPSPSLPQSPKFADTNSLSSPPV
jgi:hypothetical protein